MNEHHTHFRAARDEAQPRRNRRRPDHFEAWAFGPGFGPGGPRRGRRPGRRGGDVRAAVLLLLAEQPRHGYDLIGEIGARSNGVWNPSPGSVYPVLAQLEDEGLISIERIDGRKTASLTDEGRQFVRDHADELGTPWQDVQSDVDPDRLREAAKSVKGLMMAFRQVAETGSPADRVEAVRVLDEARRSLYAILASDNTDA